MAVTSTSENQEDVEKNEEGKSPRGESSRLRPAAEVGVFTVLLFVLLNADFSIPQPLFYIELQNPPDSGQVRPAVHDLFLIVTVFAWVSLRLRGMRWKDVGLRRDGALTGRGLAILIGGTAIGFAMASIGDLSSYGPVRGNWQLLLYWVYMSAWAGITEELVYRGWLLNRLADIFGRTTAGWIISATAGALLFGVGHVYLGVAGLISVTLGGFFAGILYLVNRQNLWVLIVVHFLVDALHFVAIYVGVFD